MKLHVPRSLYGQVTLAQIVTLVVAAVALPVLASTLLARTATRYQNRLLVAQGEAVAGQTHRDHFGQYRVDLSGALGPLYASRYDGRAFAIVTADGAIVARSPFGFSALVGEVPRGEQVRRFQSGPMLAVSVPAEVDGARFWVVASQDMRLPGAITDDIVSTFRLRFLLYVGIGIVSLMAVNVMLVRRSMEAVRRASDEAAGIGPTAFGVRIAHEALPEDVAPLAKAANAALDRLEASYRTQGEFVSNVAHELRTPLATLKLELDGLPEGAERQSIRQLADRMSHVVTQLFDLASVERLQAEDAGHFELDALARQAVADAAPEVLAGGRTIGLSAPNMPVAVKGNAHLIGLALANLIDNASRHTPVGSHIEVRVTEDGAVAVQDDGPGIAADEVGLVTRRFWRKDHGRSDSAGIGLSIVESIATASGAKLRIGNRHPHGAEFMLALPLAARDTV